MVDFYEHMQCGLQLYAHISLSLIDREHTWKKAFGRFE